MEQHTQVLIVGAGLTGLLAAHILAQHQINYRILEQPSDLKQDLNPIALSAKDMEMFATLGLHEEILEQGQVIRTVNYYGVNTLLTQLNLTSTSTSAFPVVSIQRTVLRTLLLKLLAEIKPDIAVETNSKVLSIKQFEQQAQVQIVAKTHTELLNVDWVIACDGQEGVVRDLLQPKYISTAPVEYAITLNARLQSNLTDNAAHHFINSHGTLILTPLSAGITHLFAQIKQGNLIHKKQLSLNDFNEICKTRCYFPIECIETVSMQHMRITEGYLEQFKQKRVLYAGEAAFQCNPLAESAGTVYLLSTYNLAWKLALVINSHACSSLLTSYTAEFLPQVKRRIKQTKYYRKLSNIKNPRMQKLRDKIIQLAAKNEKISCWLLNTASANISNPLHYEYIDKSSVKSVYYQFFRYAPKIGENVSQLISQLAGPTIQGLTEYFASHKHKLFLFQGVEESLDKNSLADMQLELNDKYHQLLDAFIVVRDNTLPATTWPNQVIFDKCKELHSSFGAAAACFYLIQPDHTIAFRALPANLSYLKDYLRRVYGIKDE